MKKIAVCIYGITPFEIRRYNNNFIYRQEIEEKYKFNNESYFSLKTWKENILDKNNCDVYIHNWIISDNVDKISNYGYNNVNVNDVDKLKNKMIEIFNPVSYIFEEVRPLNNMESHTLSMFKSTSLIKKDYDFVLLCRADTVWFNDIDLSDFDSDKFYVSHYKWWDQKLYGSKKAAPGVYFGGNSTNIKKYTQLYNDLHKFPYEDIDYDPHIIYRWYLEHTNLIDITERKLNPGLNSNPDIENIDFNIESRVISFEEKRIC